VRDVVWASDSTTSGRKAAEPLSHFQITSPLQGDHYRIPPGVEARYATIALRAVGGPAEARTRWYVDDRRVSGPRWILVPGHHEIRAEAGTDRAAVTITVDSS
jgi:hypothetical protein